jgi:sugar phosphate permease
MGSIKRWRVQIFAITWLAYAAFYFTRKAFSVAKLGIGDDPSFPPRQDDDGQPGRPLPRRVCRRPVHLGHACRPLWTAGGGARWLADFGAGAALVMGTFATLPIFVTCMLVQGLAQSTGWSGLCKNLGSFLPGPAAGAGAGVMEFVLRVRRIGRVTVCRVVGVYADRQLARGVYFQCRSGSAGGRAVLYVPAQYAAGCRLAGSRA